MNERQKYYLTKAMNIETFPELQKNCSHLFLVEKKSFNREKSAAKGLQYAWGLEEYYIYYTSASILPFH